jgi:hypothetical protein
MFSGLMLKTDPFLSVVRMPRVVQEIKPLGGFVKVLQDFFSRDPDVPLSDRLLKAIFERPVCQFHGDDQVSVRLP